MAESYGIRDLADEFGVTTRTIRFYEDQGMIAPLREGQRRIYCQRDRTRLKLILRGRRLGFSLAEIREIVDLYDAPSGEAGQLNLLLERIAARRAELEAKRRDIAASLRDLDAVAESCRKHLEQLKNEGATAGARRAGR
jgi:DNA-binding transcriptional MerR regulator